MKTEMHRRHLATRLGMPADAPITLLHIGEHETAVATAAPAQVLLLAIGSQRTAAEFFVHVPPTPGEIENAIQHVEDEVSRAREMIAGHPVLVTSDASIREIAYVAGGRVASEATLSIDEVERVFSLLASHSQGRPPSSAGIPGSTEFAATLLILREFMHHLGFASVSVVD
jgi:exopolyphosphatase/pppGpp-phosphohydrolase